MGDGWGGLAAKEHRQGSNPRSLRYGLETYALYPAEPPVNPPCPLCLGYVLASGFLPAVTDQDREEAHHDHDRRPEESHQEEVMVGQEVDGACEAHVIWRRRRRRSVLQHRSLTRL